MFKSNKHTLINNIQNKFISGRKHTFIRKKIRTNRKSFCISIIGPKLWNYYYNMMNIKKNMITFKKDVNKMFL